jgi:hypothetical protein
MDLWNLPAGSLGKSGDTAALYRRWSLSPLARLLQYRLTFECINDNLSAPTDFFKENEL